MHRFFIEKEQLEASQIRITGDDYNHIHNVLRLKTGEEVLLCVENDDKEYLCKLAGYDNELEYVYFDIVDIFGNHRELPIELVLFQGLPKGDKMELIIQKAVELGVSAIVPVAMNRSVVKLDEKKAKKKVERYNGIALSAAKQSKRGKIPKVTDVMTMKDACAYAKDMESIVLPYELASGMEMSRQLLLDASKRSSVGIFVGPEGGFTTEEVEMIEKIGGKRLSLGHRILRTETAGMVVLSILMFLSDHDKA